MAKQGRNLERNGTKWISSNSSTSRFGFGGKERDGEWQGGAAYDYGFRIYDARLGKFLSVDPLTTSYSMLTPYQFASNSPISGIYLDGLEWYYTANGKLIGKYGESDEVRVIKHTELKSAIAAFADQENTPDGYFQHYLPSSMGSYAFSQVKENIQIDIIMFIANEEIWLQAEKANFAVKRKDGNLASWTPSTKTITIDDGYAHVNNKSALVNMLVKENTHITDEDIEYHDERELNGYMNAITHSSFKDTPDSYKKTILVGAGQFIWNVQRWALVYANDGDEYSANYLQNMVDGYMRQVEKAGYSIDLSITMEKFKSGSKINGGPIPLQARQGDVKVKY